MSVLFNTLSRFVIAFLPRSNCLLISWVQSQWHPLQYCCLENPMDGGAWRAAVHGVAKSRTRLSDFTFTFHLHALEKEMATHSSVLAWRIPGMGDSGGLPSMGSHRVRHDWCDLAAAAVTVHSDFGAQESKICHGFHLFPFYLPWSDGTRCHDLSFLNVEF